MHGRMIRKTTKMQARKTIKRRTHQTKVSLFSPGRDRYKKGQFTQNGIGLGRYVVYMVWGMWPPGINVQWMNFPKLEGSSQFILVDLVDILGIQLPSLLHFLSPPEPLLSISDFLPLVDLVCFSLRNHRLLELSLRKINGLFPLT